MRARRLSEQVLVGRSAIGGNAPVSVQSMTDTPTADIEATAAQVQELAQAGAELVRVTINTEEAARALPEIRKRLEGPGREVPLIGDFHFNGHLLLKKVPECARTLDKYRINPGNVGRGSSHAEHFAEICRIARDQGKPVRIGVNSGSLDEDLIRRLRETGAGGEGPGREKDLLREAMVRSALESEELALRAGLTAKQIVLSVKTSEGPALIEVTRELARRTRAPLHLGLTEAGPGMPGAVCSSAALGILLSEGIGDTIRVSLTPSPGASRTEEVLIAQEILQTLGIRNFYPRVTACPGCGRTASSIFRAVAFSTQALVQSRGREWKQKYPGVEDLTIAVMGCVVNGPGESKHASIGLSMPGAGEEPAALLFADGRRLDVLRGGPEEIARKFAAFIEDYILRRFSR